MSEIGFLQTVQNMPRSFDRDVGAFIEGITSLAVTLPLAESAVHTARIRAAKEFEDFLNSNARIEQEDKEKHSKIYAVDLEDGAKVLELHRRQRAARIAEVVIPQSFVVSLVSQFDVHIGRLIRTMYFIEPQKLTSSQKTFTYADLTSFTSIDDAREMVIEKEVESVLRENHAEQFKWLENKLGITLRKELSVWPEFVEVTERRNLFVHTDGLVLLRRFT